MISSPGWWPSSAPTQPKNRAIEFWHPPFPPFPKQRLFEKFPCSLSKWYQHQKKKAFLSKAFPECSDQAKSPKRVCQGVRERGESYCWAPHWHQHGWSPGFLGTLPPPPQAKERTTFLPMELIASFGPTPTSPLKNKNKSSCSESRPATLETLAYAGKQPDG